MRCLLLAAISWEGDMGGASWVVTHTGPWHPTGCRAHFSAVLLLCRSYLVVHRDPPIRPPIQVPLSLTCLCVQCQ